MSFANEMTENSGTPRFAVSHRLSVLSGCNGNLPASVAGRRAIDRIAGDAAKVSLAGRLISRASRGSDVRFELVAELRQRIEDGTYRVSASDLADRLMGSMRG